MLLHNIGATPFEIVDADSKTSLIQFNRSEQDFDLEEWIEVPRRYSDKMEKYLSVSGHAIGTGAQVGTISALVPNGLYAATASPAALMAYSNSTIGSAVMGSSGIIGHAGFSSVAGAVFAPILIFQAMSLITGHYYMNGVSRQLAFIDKKLKEIIELHHLERVAKIRYCRRVFKELSGREIINIEDMIQFQNAMTQIGVIHEEYSEQINRVDINEIRNAEKSFWTSDKIRQIANQMDENYDYKLKIAVLTDELYHIGKIVELHLNAKMRDDPETRNLRINELIQEIKGWNENHFYFNSERNRQAEHYYQEIIQTLKNIYYNAFFEGDQADILKRQYEDRYSKFQTEISDRSKDKAQSLLKISKNLIDNLESSKDMLLLKSDAGIKVFIKKTFADAAVPIPTVSGELQEIRPE